MQIDLGKIDLGNFMAHPHTIAGETCFLVQPQHIGAKWNRDNLVFRSSIWDSQGNPVSLSFKKFFNWGEQPDLTFTPLSTTVNGGVNLLEKIDGSTLIVSKYKGQTIIRTRGTVDATKQENGYEIDYLRQKYPKAFDLTTDDTCNYSILFEWVTPTNRIVLNYGSEPEIYLIGVIDHTDYSMMTQSALDRFAEMLGVKRPRRFEFDSIADMLTAVEALKGQEGICCYCNRDQDIRKIKSAFYLAAHRLKSEIGSYERIIDYWFTIGKPTYQEAEKYFSEQFDFEIFNLCRGDISRICTGYKEVQKTIEHMNAFVQPLKTMPRKAAAERIIQAYGQTNRSSMLFKLLDDRQLNDDDVKKLLYQVTKD